MGRLLETLALVTVVSGSAQGQSVESCRAHVGAFYKWYVKVTENSGYELAVKKRPAYFSAAIRNGLGDDSRWKDKHPGELVGLDFDPFLNAQDVAQKYAVGKVSRSGKRFRAEVYGIWNGKRNPKPDVTPELTFERRKWVFVNFRYGPKRDENLLSYMAEYRRDRKKPQ